MADRVPESPLEVRVPTINNHGLVAWHDQACSVCYRAHAVFDCQTGIFHPCWKCHQSGWVLLKSSLGWRQRIVAWIARTLR